MLVGETGEVLEGRSRGELALADAEGEYTLGSLRYGTLLVPGEGWRGLSPRVLVYRKTAEGKEKVGWLSTDEPLVVEGKSLRMGEVSQQSGLTFRYDPSIPLLWFSGILVIVAMTVRVFGFFHRFRIVQSGSTVVISARTIGLLARTDRLVSKMTERLRRRVEGN